MKDVNNVERPDACWSTREQRPRPPPRFIQSSQKTFNSVLPSEEGCQVLENMWAFYLQLYFLKKCFFPQASSLCPIKHGTKEKDGWILFSCFKVPPCLNSPSNWYKSSETWEKPSSQRGHSLPLPVSKFFVCLFH